MGRPRTRIAPLVAGDCFEAGFGSYGTQVVFPVSFEGTNTRNFEQCNDMSA